MRINSLIFILGITCIITACTTQEKKLSTPKKTPNVVLIVVDDLGYADVSITGIAKDVHTPSMDALAKSGTRFTNAYATASICNPSRAGLITGNYQHRWGTFWYGGKGMHNPAYKTIAELLKAADYTTGYVGKVHYGNNDHDVTNRSFPLNHGFDYFYGHTSPRKHYLNHTAQIETEFLASKKEHKRKGQSLRQGPLWENKKHVDTLAFATELFGAKGREFISKNKDNKFFLQLSFNAVHNFTHQLPQEYLDKNGLKGYRDWDPAKEEYYDWYKEGRKPNNPEGRAQYLGQLHFLDREIGKVTATLKALDLLENTIVVLVSDNGGSTPIYANNAPLRGSKYTLYEGGIRVPLMISYPRAFKAGLTSDNLISSMDILPTICNAVGIEAPSKLDGKDVSELLKGNDNNVEHDFLVWDNGAQTAVRQGKWKLRTASLGAKGNSDYEMVEMQYGDYLYDLDTDIGEQVNLAEKFPEKLAELKAIHKAWREDIKVAK